MLEMCVKLFLFASVVFFSGAKCALLSRDETLDETFLPAECPYYYETWQTMICDGQFPDLSHANRSRFNVNALRIQNCASIFITKNKLQNFTKLFKLTIDCGEITMEEDAFDDRSNVSILTIGRKVGTFPRNVFCPLSLTQLNLNNNDLMSDEDFGLLTNCSSLSQPVDCLKKLNHLVAQNNMLTSLNKDGFLCNLKQLEVLNLMMNAISTIENGVFEGMANLKHLYLGNNQIYELVDGLFDSLVALKILELSNNRLITFPTGLFKNLISLEKLYLNENYLKKINPGTFESLIRMNVLILASNQLESVEGIFRNLSRLEALNLRDNRLMEVSGRTFADLPGLQLLNLRQNALAKIAPDAFSRSQKLDTLSLNGNRLTKIPDLSNCKLLVHLDLQDNYIDEINSSHFNFLNNLRFLELNNNNLTSLGASIFSQLEHLRLLDLSRNRITDIHPETFVKLPVLSHLNLASNQLSFSDFKKNKISVFSPLHYLVHLNLSCNQIIDFQYSWFPPNLHYLDLSHNSIQQLPFPNIFNTYLSLDLSHNLITNLSRYQFPAHVTRLQLNDNKITRVDVSAFQNLNTLEFINISGNSLTTLPPLNIWNKHSEVFLKNNPWICDCQLLWLKLKKLERSSTYVTSKMNCTVSNSNATVAFDATNIEDFVCVNRGSSPSSPCYTSECSQEQLCPAGCWCFHDIKWEKVEIYCNQSSKVTSLPQKLPFNTTSLDVENCQIETIKDNILQNFKIKRLSVKNSFVKKIDENAFFFVKSLETIDLSYNQLSVLDKPIFKSLSNLTRVDLSHNRLYLISLKMFDGLFQLQVLNLTHNRLTNYPFWHIDGLHYVAWLGITDNPWTCRCGVVELFNKYIESHKHAIGNSGDLYCEARNEAIYVLNFNFSKCEEVAGLSELTTIHSNNDFPTEKSQSIEMEKVPDSSIAPTVVLSVLFTVSLIALAVFAFIFRCEIRIFLSRRFSRLLLNL